ncbi:MAG: CDP-alcohol phosphatidyltransferase family protein [Caldilineaceae bacterium]|nr:CDP-alcohol phosphatidyltransferase family protein [Caldilineaceae bacterium]
MQNYYDAEQAIWPPTKRQRLLAWSAHLFTATGSIWGLLTLLAITNGEWILAFGWMGAAILVDSFDGFLARQVRVKEVLPEFDGALLDNMLDFLNYVFVPAFFLSQSNLLPEPVGLLGAILILLASSYQFCQNDAKTEDHYFKGFPSYWNIMVYYLFILNLDGWVNFAVVAILAVLVFVPIKYIYPSRTNFHQALTLLLTALWAIANAIILFTYPAHSPWLVWFSLLFALYYTGMSLFATYFARK